MSAGLDAGPLAPILFIETTNHQVVTPAQAGVHFDFGFAKQQQTGFQLPLE
jgi:hypothetical protein